MTSSRVSSLAVVLLAVMLLALYASIARDLVLQWWEDPNYSHGFVVPIFSGYLAWQKRHDLLRHEPRPSWLGLPVLLAGLAALVLGTLGAENFLTRSSLIVVLAGLVLFHCGRDVARGVAFPLCFLLFMVPLPQIVFNAIAFPLQGVAAENATAILEAFGVPVLRDGNVIHLSRLTLGVTEACSGIRSLISLLALAVGWAYISFSQPWAILLLALSAIPITIAANAGRIVLSGLLGQWFGVQYAEGFFHAFSGWLIFLVALACLLMVEMAISSFSRGREKRSAD